MFKFLKFVLDIQRFIVSKLDHIVRNNNFILFVAIHKTKLNNYLFIAIG